MVQYKNTIDCLPPLAYFINVKFYLTKGYFAFIACLKLAKHLPFCIFATIVMGIVKPTPQVFYFQ